MEIEISQQSRTIKKNNDNIVYSFFCIFLYSFLLILKKKNNQFSVLTRTENRK